MLPIGVATTYSVPGRVIARLPVSLRSTPVRALLVALSLMAVIVGAACQPLQPADLATHATATATATEATTSRAANPPAMDGGPDRFTTGQAGSVPAGGPMSSTGASTGSPTGASTMPLVALLVPLSGRQQALGEAVRDGFIAAHLETPSGAQVRIMMIDEAAMSAALAWRQAEDAGASVLVGPLLKESVQAIASLSATMTMSRGADPVSGSARQMPILALNSLGDNDVGTGSIWQFGLAPEDEARAVARRASALGQRRAAVLVPASEWGQRLLSAFSDEFRLHGGTVVDTRTYLPGSPDYSQPIKSLLGTTEPLTGVPASGTNPDELSRLGPGHRSDIDLIFVGTSSSNGRQLVPQLKFFGGGDLPTYATSAIWDDDAGDARDLNGVIFPDGPWVIAPDGRATLVKNGIALHWGRAALNLSRLYALGYDAYRLLPVIRNQASPGPFASGEVAGSTGTLYADASGRIHRRLGFARIRDGRLEPLPAADPTEDLRGY